MIEIVEAKSSWELDEVRKLIRSFVSWHRERHTEDLVLIDEYFDKKAFEDELETLPGKYSPPTGRLLLATFDGKPAGCVALREIDPLTCEMKRMFIYQTLHGKGIGRALGARIIEEARSMGYSVMKLDTSIRQTEAQRLYQSLGFKESKPYSDLPMKVQNWLVFMELEL